MSTTILHPSSHSPRNAGHGLRTFFGIVGIVAAMLLGTNVCRAAGSGVLDNGAFFSEQAKSDAAKVIGEMERTLHEDLAIETFKEIPADLKAGVNVQDKTALGHLFEQWASRQFKQKGINGVYVLIVKEPAHLQISVGNNTQRQAFTLKDRDALSSLMRAKLHARQNDEALRDGANFVFATMKSHTNPRARTGTAAMPLSSQQAHPTQSSGGIGGWLIPALVIGVVVWLVIGLFRALSGRMGGGSAMGQAPGGGGGGGGFLSSLVGGMFGAAAGMWMYDQFSSHGNSAYGSDRNDQNGGNAGDSGFSGQDTDSTSSGGDFGGDSGGGDSGGGGGDFGGGGDSGGGGDF